MFHYLKSLTNRVKRLAKQRTRKNIAASIVMGSTQPQDA